MYNMLFGENELADDLLKMLNLTKEDCGRYRDCYLDEKGEKIILTPNSHICEYSSGLLARIWKAENILPLQGETLLNDILKHYKVEQPYFQIETGSLSEIASRYLKRCEGSGMINSSVKKYIEGKKI